MDNENKFWLALWTMCGVCILGIGVLMTYSAHLEDTKLTQMVENGVDPLRAKCALSSTEATKASAVCIALANEK